LDKPLRRFFVHFTEHYVVDYYAVFIAVPILVTIFLGLGFIWIEQLTILGVLTSRSILAS